MAGKIVNCKNRRRSALLTLPKLIRQADQGQDAHRLASPFRKGEGEGEGFLRKTKVCRFQTPHLNRLSCSRGEAKKQDAVAWARRRFFKVPVMALIAFPLTRPFYTAVW